MTFRRDLSGPSAKLIPIPMPAVKRFPSWRMLIGYSVIGAADKVRHFLFTHLGRDPKVP